MLIRLLMILLVMLLIKRMRLMSKNPGQLIASVCDDNNDGGVHRL